MNSLFALLLLATACGPGDRNPSPGDDSGAGSAPSVSTPTACTLRIATKYDPDNFDEWTYNDDGDLTSTDQCRGESSSDGAGCEGERFTYEPAGHLTSVGSIEWQEDEVSSTFSLTWDGDTLVASNNGTITFEYGADGLVTAIRGQSAGDETFIWGDGDELAVWERSGGDADRRNTYTWEDGLLMAYARPDANMTGTFAYDSDGVAIGQVQDWLDGGTPTAHAEYTYSYVEGQLTSVTEVRVEYDAEFGDTETTSENTYEYDGADLIALTDGNLEYTVTGDCPRSPTAWSPGDDLRDPVLQYSRFHDILQGGYTNIGTSFSPWPDLFW